LDPRGHFSSSSFHARTPSIDPGRTDTSRVVEPSWSRAIHFAPRWLYQLPETAASQGVGPKGMALFNSQITN
jgi:hypothetical protein